jgi:hypothetical protein
MAKTAVVEAKQQKRQRAAGKASSTDPAFIVNIGDVRTVMMKPTGMYVIPARDEDPEKRGYSVTRIEYVDAPMDLGEGRRTFIHVNAIYIAKDLVRELQEDVEKDGMSRGYFVIEAEEPTQKQLEEAHALRKKFLEYRIGVGDEEWQAHGQVRLIPGDCKRAVKELNLQREWAKTPETKVPCTYCDEPVTPGVAICKHCGAILNKEKAEQGGLTPPDPAKGKKQNTMIRRYCLFQFDRLCRFLKHWVAGLLRGGNC